MEETIKVVKSFRDEYMFLSNFFLTEVQFEGLTYKNSEAAFQSAKTLDMGKRKQFQSMNPLQAKRAGKKVELREDWEEVKNQIMYQICKDKFERNFVIRDKLIELEGVELIEGNNYGDTYWGVSDGIGENHLGKILMRVRDELIEQFKRNY